MHVQKKHCARNVMDYVSISYSKRSIVLHEGAFAVCHLKVEFHADQTCWLDANEYVHNFLRLTLPLLLIALFLNANYAVFAASFG